MLYIYYPNYAIQFLASLLLQLSHFIFRWVSQSPLFSATSKKENGSRVTLAFVSQNIRSVRYITATQAVLSPQAWI